MKVDEIPLTFSKPSVIQETRAHFDTLLKKAADREDVPNTAESDKDYPSQVLSPVHRSNLGKEAHQHARKRKKKHHRSSKQMLIEPDEEFSHTDEDIITSNDEIYVQKQISNDVIVHHNPVFTSDSDSNESSNKEKDIENKKIFDTAINKKHVESNSSKYDLNSNDSSLSSFSKQSVDLIHSLNLSDEEMDGWESSMPSAKQSDKKAVLEDNKINQPTPPPRTKKISEKISLKQRLSKLNLHFSHSTLSSYVSSEDSFQTAVRLSPAASQVVDKKLSEDIQSAYKRRRESQAEGADQEEEDRRENIELKPVTEWTPSYEEIDGSMSPSRVADTPLSKSQSVKRINQKKRTDSPIQSYDEIEDSQNESIPEDNVPKDMKKKLKSKQEHSPTEKSISTAKSSRERKSLENLSKRQVSDFDVDRTENELRDCNYNYDQVVGLLIHQCDRLQMDSLIIHPVVRVHVVDIATGKYLKKSSKKRCYSYEEPTNIDFIQPVSTQPCNVPSLRLLTPTWEEMLILNEDIRYITAEGMNVIILFEINDFVSFEMASLQYKTLGSEGGWHRIAWAFLKPVASNGSTNLNKRLRLQLFRPAPEKRGKTSSEKCDVYQHWLKGCRSRYPSTLHVTVLGVKPSSDLPSPHSTFHHDPGSIDVLSPSLALPVDQDQDSGTEVADQRSSKDDIAKMVNTPEVVSWSRIPGQTCKIPNEKSLTLSAGNLGCFCLRFSPCGKFLAADSANHNSHSLLIYAIPGGSLVKRFHGHQGLIYDLQWSNGSRFILSASADCTACVWDVETALVKMLPHPSFVYSACFFREDDEALRVVTGCCDHVLRLWWRLDKHKDFVLASELRGHEGFITSICHDETGKFYSADSEGKILIWNCEESGLSLLKDVKIRELNGVAISRLVPHPGGQRLLVHSRDSTLRIINITTGSPIQWFSGAVNHRLQTGATLSPCGRLVLSASEDGSFWLWNADTGKQLAVYFDIIQRATSNRSVLPLSGTVDYHPLEHMVAFSVYGKQAPIVVCVYAKNGNGKSVGLHLMPGNKKESFALLSNDAVCDWLGIAKRRPEGGDSKGSFSTKRDDSVNPTKPSHSYEGSLASIIQQMDEVIALTRRSIHSSERPRKELSPRRRAVTTPKHDRGITSPEQHRNTASPESSIFPQLTRVSENQVSSRSSFRRKPHDVLHEQHQIKRRHSGFEDRQEPVDVVYVETSQTGRKSSVVISEVAPLLSTVGTVEKAVNNGNFGDLIGSNENASNKIKNTNQRVESVSAIHSDNDTHVVDLTEVLS